MDHVRSLKSLVATKKARDDGKASATTAGWARAVSGYRCKHGRRVVGVTPRQRAAGQLSRVSAHAITGIR